MIIIFLIILILITPLAFAFTQWDFLRNLENASNKEYNRDWHGFQWITLFCSVCLGYLLSFYSFIYYPMIAVILWILSDGFQNKLKRNGFWTVNINSTDILVSISMWYVKISLLVITILLITIYNFF